MLQSINVPWMQGMNFGMGVNLLNGAIAGRAVEPGTITTPTNAAGQTVSYHLTRITTLEELYSSIGISVDASGHYGLFSAAGKFSLSQDAKFNSQSTFLLARCVVANAFAQCERAAFAPGIADLLTANRQAEFQERFGDGFVRGMQTGGEFHAIIAITAISREDQSLVASSLQAKYGGLFTPGGDVDVALTTEEKSKIARTELVVSTFQRGGQGDELSLTSDVEAVMKRLKEFPGFVLRSPVPYEVQVASYVTLPRPPGPSPLDIEAKKSALAEYASLQLKLLSLQNDVQFVQLHPSFFLNPPAIGVVNAWGEAFAQQFTALKRQARACVNGVADEGCPALPLRLPEGFAMPERTLGLAGVWEQTGSVGGTSKWTFSLRSANQYDAVEEGLGQARGIAVLNGLSVVFDFKASVDDTTGRYTFAVNKDFTSGEGTIEFFAVHTDLGILQNRWLKLA